MTRSKQRCHALDCKESFIPKMPHQKYHSPKCSSLERQRRHWAKKFRGDNAE